MPEGIVEIVDQDYKPYEKSGEKEEPLLVLSHKGEEELNKLFGSKKIVESFKELLEKESGEIEDEHEAGFLQPNTALDYNNMYGAAIERRDYYNLVFENLLRDLKRLGEEPGEGQTTDALKQRALQSLGLELDLASEEIQQEIKAAKTQEIRDKKRGDLRREAGIDSRGLYGG
ncbi:hypothetical protein JW752_03730 [Candidatus Peregrinibacteria bacterium]|nr:hypothetical protein [Candidatus Peregrinibacteria bacterium]